MSDIGYKNKNQAALLVSYDDVEDYVACLREAIKTPYPEYEAIGVRDGDERIQLSTSLLQIENEYYSFIRPKRTVQAGERPTSALRERGVEYVEVRALDVACTNPIGVEIEQLYFLEAFLIFCLLEESSTLSTDELRAMEYNELTVALRGRTPALELICGRERRDIREWSLDICSRMEPICAFLDTDDAGRHYEASRKRIIDTIEDPDSLPSARILEALRSADQPFHYYSLDLSLAHRSHFAAMPPDDGLNTRFERLAVESHEEQRRLESDDSTSFEDFVRAYLDT